jgi:hypothetical protein
MNYQIIGNPFSFPPESVNIILVAENNEFDILDNQNDYFFNESKTD